MQNGYYQATAGMVTQFNRLNVISNNLANVNTIGYKRNDVVIGDFARIFKETQDELPLKNHTKDGAKFLNRTLDRVPQVSEEYTDFSAGGFKYSSNTLDFAIKRDDAFFLVDTPNGVKLALLALTATDISSQKRVIGCCQVAMRRKILVKEVSKCHKARF